jgi:hypothetical protein
MDNEMSHIRQAMTHLEGVAESKASRKNQIFRTLPSDELVDKVIKAFGLRGLSDRSPFSRKDLALNGTVKKLTDMMGELEAVYLPCKSRTYLHGINEKNVTTIFRQLLKTKGHTIESQEKYMKGQKFIMYHIVPWVRAFSDDDDDKSVGSGAGSAESPVTIVKQPVKIVFN